MAQEYPWTSAGPHGMEGVVHVPRNVDERIATAHQRNCCGQIVIAIAQMLYRPLDPSPDIALENVANEPGLTALMDAAVHGEAAVVRKLLQSGASVGLVNHYGRNALILATMAGQRDIVALLLAVDAPIDAVDAWDRDALGWAETRGHFHIAELLRAKADARRADQIRRLGRPQPGVAHNSAASAAKPSISKPQAQRQQQQRPQQQAPSASPPSQQQQPSPPPPPPPPPLQPSPPPPPLPLPPPPLQPPQQQQQQLLQQLLPPPSQPPQPPPPQQQRQPPPQQQQRQQQQPRPQQQRQQQQQRQRQQQQRPQPQPHALEGSSSSSSIAAVGGGAGTGPRGVPKPSTKGIHHGGAQDGANPPASAPAGEDFPTVAAEEPSVPGRPGQRSSWVRGVLSSRGAVLGAGIFSSRSISSRLRSGPPRAHSSQQPAAGGAQPSGSSSTPPTGQWAFQGLFDGLLGRPAILDTPHYSPAAPSPSKLRFSPEALAADEAAAAVRAATSQLPNAGVGFFGQKKEIVYGWDAERPGWEWGPERITSASDVEALYYDKPPAIIVGK